MRKHILLIVAILLPLVTFAGKTNPEATVYVDKNGVMRWTDTRKEASFFGVNYTLPFAHAYRVMDYLSIDHKEAIDKDVYHFARLGFNAYRIHIWDVEISDQQGNLIENKHLDLLDYLIARLKERNIHIVITAMTTFGNGYPERNQPTEGFSYLYDKCEVHDHPDAVAAQENYISKLVSHINPYTGKAYMNDPAIIGFEINNEPCHAGTQQQTREYINRMLVAIKKAGNRKPVFYNVSHNMQQIEAYYSTPIQGTTYQWYPIGLVAGHTRKGNFLPYVDSFNIPFQQVKGFSNKAKLIYEFDPADITYSYMYPAMARTFRTAGFQWITQFAYDPIDMARANTEYQTHFLNLAYTPQKAISMKIAAEVVQQVPMYTSYGTYPADTLFGNFRVSYREDLSEMNTPEKFYYSSTTVTQPVNPGKLEAITGYGNSPIVKYEGTGAYFLDKLGNGVWRLEVMPDAIQINDPFARPSLDKEVVTIVWNNWDMEINLSDLGNNFIITGINNGNTYTNVSSGNRIHQLTPGVYLLKGNDAKDTEKWQNDSAWKTIRLNEYVAPAPHCKKYYVSHTAVKQASAQQALSIKAMIAGPQQPDSVIIYTDKVSFWNPRNPYIKMERRSGYEWEAEFPAEQVNTGQLKYHIIVCKEGKQYTFPDATTGGPLEWDFISNNYYETTVSAPGSPILFSTITTEYSDLEAYTIPEEKGQISRQLVRNNPVEEPTLRLTFRSEADQPSFYLRKYIREEIQGKQNEITMDSHLCIHLKNAPERFRAGFINSNGFTYRSDRSYDGNESVIRIPLAEMNQAPTAILPHAYPVFLDKYFIPQTTLPFLPEEIETFELSFEGETNSSYEIEIGSCWIE